MTFLLQMLILFGDRELFLILVLWLVVELLPRNIQNTILNMEFHG